MMSFMTPPPEFEENVRTKVLFNNANCIVEDVFYPSPISIHSDSRSASYSPHTPPTSQHEQKFIESVDDHQALFGENTSYESSAISPPFSMSSQYQMFDQQPWSSFHGMSEQYPVSHGHREPQFFSSYQTPQSSLPANMIPGNPMPAPSSTYSFVDGHVSSGYPPLSVRQTFTPDRSASMSVYSRSCSPNPSHITMAGLHVHGRQVSRASSVTSSTSPLSNYGVPVRAPGSSPNSHPQAWRCAYPNCTSRATFIRGCDLRKHYNRHSKHLFCRVDGCPQSEAAAMTAAQAADPQCTDSSQLVLSGGFSSKKDRARHEAKHNPGIKCEWQGSDGEGCGRVFSRMDNMKDHVRRIHQKGQNGGESAAEKSRRAKRTGSR